jgi:hypothetical protein
MTTAQQQAEELARKCAGALINYYVAHDDITGAAEEIMAQLNLTELIEAKEERDRAHKILDLNAHDFRQLRHALDCDGSDLPQLIAAIDKLRQQNQALMEVAKAVYDTDNSHNLDTTETEWVRVKQALANLKTLGIELE